MMRLPWLYRWARRRHPNKSRRWVARRYFHSVGRQNWVFWGTVAGRDGTSQMKYLFRAAGVPIRRHIKVKGAFNPYDPDWELYLEERLGLEMARDLKGRRKLLHLCTQQEGICPVCNQRITRVTGWHDHHIIWRSEGGTDRADNRVLLHPNCHRQAHAQRLHIVKPRPARGV
jgi:RNA-directed DNA polymerase